MWERYDRVNYEVTDIPKGFRDVMWCPYANEPTFLAYVDGKPTCLECDGNFEFETHEFICHIKKSLTG